MSPQFFINILISVTALSLLFGMRRQSPIPNTNISEENVLKCFGAGDELTKEEVVAILMFYQDLKRPISGAKVLEHLHQLTYRGILVREGKQERLDVGIPQTLSGRVFEKEKYSLPKKT